MSTHAKAPFGVMVVNLGTPENPDAASVRRYLAQFLSDPRVIRVPRLLWWLILHGIILRIRPKKVAALYQSVWTDNGSPLMSISVQQKNALSKALEQQLGQAIPVELAMTYGEPSLKSAGLKLAKAGRWAHSVRPRGEPRPRHRPASFQAGSWRWRCNPASRAG